MKNIALVAALAAAIAIGPAAAAPITYVASGIGSGSLGTTSFASATITLTFTGDTLNVTQPFAGIFTNAVGSLAIDIASVGSATFTDAVQAVDNQNFTLAGFGDNTLDAFILGTTDASFGSYDLTTATGPVSNSATFNSGTVFATSQGAFTITSMNRTTFSASSGAATPEPSTISLIGVAIAAAVGLRRGKTLRV